MGAQALLGRSLFALIFLSSAINKAKTFGSDGGPAAAYAAPKLDAIKAQIASVSGISLDALPIENKHYIAIACALEGVGAAFFILGSDLGAQMLLLFLFAVTPIMHDFWNVSDQTSAAALIDQISFFKNVALAGALLFYLAMKRDMARQYVNEKLKAA